MSAEGVPNRCPFVGQNGCPQMRSLMAEMQALLSWERDKIVHASECEWDDRYGRRTCRHCGAKLR